MKFSKIIFDLDDTLYPPTNGIWAMIRDRIDHFMVTNLGYTEQEAPEARGKFFNKYGTTLRGLQAAHHIDPVHYLQYVHDIPIRDIIKPNQTLQATLSSISAKKVIFTNADRWHANRVLKALDVDSYFEEIVDILDIQPYCKPMPEAFKIALQKFEIHDPSTCLFVDDSLRNITIAKQIGLHTIWVTKDKNNATMTNYKVEKVEDILGLFPNKSFEGL